MLRIVTRNTENEGWMQRRFSDLLQIILDERDVFCLDETELQGDIVLLKIRNYYNQYGLIDCDAAPSDNIEDFVPMMEAKLQYITAYEFDENDYSLYKLQPGSLKAHYISNGYLPMRLGPPDKAAYEKYRKLAAMIYG